MDLTGKEPYTNMIPYVFLYRFMFTQIFDSEIV